MTFYCFYQKKCFHLKKLKSNTMNTSSVTLLRFTFISLLFLMSSCLNEKDEVTNKKDNESAFFEFSYLSTSTNSRNYTPHECITEIIRRLKLKNDKENFIPGFINHLGYPLWNNYGYYHSQKGETMYVVPIKNLLYPKEINSLWIFAVEGKHIKHLKYNKWRINQSLEKTWVFDYFTTYALGETPSSNIHFINNSTRSWQEELHCMYTEASAGENYYEKGWYCWEDMYWEEDRDTDDLYNEGGGGYEELPEDGGGGQSQYNDISQTIKDRFIKSNINLSNSQIETLEEAYALMIERCEFEKLNKYMSDAGALFEKIRMKPSINGENASYNPNKVLTLTSDESINMFTLAHEYFHLFQHKEHDWTYNNEERGLMELERNIFMDIIYEIYLKHGDTTVFYDNPDYGLDASFPLELERRYRNWLEEITNKYSSFPTNIDEAGLKEWGKIYKEYTSNAEYKKYDYENASYKFVINKALSIIKDCRN